MKRRLPTPLGWLLALAVAAGFCALGSWQLGRAQAKQAQLDQVAQVLRDRHALPLSVASQQDRALQLDWAAGTGRFAQGPAVLLDNQTRGGEPGVRAYRPFLPDDGSPPVLVDLGWHALGATRTMPAVPDLTGTHQVSGLLAPPPSPGLIRGEPVAQADGDLVAVALEPAVLGPALGRKRLAPRVLRLDPALPIGFERDLEVLPNTLPPARHLGYAVQWFGLALAVLVTAAVLTWRRRGPTREKMGHDPV